VYTKMRRRNAWGSNCLTDRARTRAPISSCTCGRCRRRYAWKKPGRECSWFMGARARSTSICTMIGRLPPSSGSQNWQGQVSCCSVTPTCPTRSPGSRRCLSTAAMSGPRDGDTRSGYALVTLGRHTQASYRRVAYDVQAAARGVRRARLPEHFADLLKSGGLASVSSLSEAGMSVGGWR